jgi:hypothetical protein
MTKHREWDGGGGGGGLPRSESRPSVRAWWHKNLREHGRYPCYALILVFPSDTEAVRYLSEFGYELHLMSGANCLIVTLNQTQFSVPAFEQTTWEKAIGEHVSSGHSATVARLLDIGFDMFPCLVIFKDIRSSNHLVVTLKDMTAQEISEKLRAIFSVIQEASSRSEDPLAALESRRNNEALVSKGQAIVGGLRGFAGKTLEAAMEAWMKAIIK